MIQLNELLLKVALVLQAHGHRWLGSCLAALTLTDTLNVERARAHHYFTLAVTNLSGTLGSLEV